MSKIEIDGSTIHAPFSWVENLLTARSREWALTEFMGAILEGMNSGDVVPGEVLDKVAQLPQYQGAEGLEAFRNEHETSLNCARIEKAMEALIETDKRKARLARLLSRGLATALILVLALVVLRQFQ